MSAEAATPARATWAERMAHYQEPAPYPLQTKAAAWEEEKHPRGAHGHFTQSEARAIREEAHQGHSPEAITAQHGGTLKEVLNILTYETHREGPVPAGSKPTLYHAREIRYRHRHEELTHAQLGAEYGLNAKQVWHIVHNTVLKEPTAPKAAPHPAPAPEAAPAPKAAPSEAPKAVPEPPVAAHFDPAFHQAMDAVRGVYGGMDDAHLANALRVALDKVREPGTMNQAEKTAWHGRLFTARQVAAERGMTLHGDGTVTHGGQTVAPAAPKTAPPPAANPHDVTEEHLRHGTFAGPLVPLKGKGNINEIYTGHLAHNGADLPVVAKPVAGLSNKNAKQAGYEEAAYVVDKAMGHFTGLPETVARDTPKGQAMVQRFLPDAPMLAGRPLTSTEQAAAAPQLHRLAVLDELIASSDRHSGNVLAVGQGADVRLVGIDHGLSFGLPKYQSRADAVTKPYWHDSLTPEDVHAIQQLADALPTLTPRLKEIGLSTEEIGWMRQRMDHMIVAGKLGTEMSVWK